MSLYNYTKQLADRLQETWETSELLFYRNLADSAPGADTRKDCRRVLYMMKEGLHDFRRHYRVVEKDNTFRIVYSCNVSGMPRIHCVVGKETGDVARYTTELVNEPHFAYNLLDPRSREACLAIADFNGDYLN
ncbi:hypothetical protein [Synechococcus phage S-N03]|uniref:Uncharacterized protein n=1 Tax=Synechococcus phage S-N03 TaxID=2718943 RepID=A0A6G8R5M9_9CAUD|nr:hypothetical protein PQC09_gp074 [Synechococcus phage S-N03]QIN96709.1 hypothetical protein [Synechococcus phage S-N03]